MSRIRSRRRFLKTTAALGVGYSVAGGIAPRESRSALETINFASVGVGGKGQSDSNDAGAAGNMVAICDIDEKTLAIAGARFNKAQKYYDYRKMLDEMGKTIDAVTVSTPDHMHAPVAAAAMRLGKHAFVQKPCTHSLHEMRVLADLAREKKLATQMGNQGTANNDLREAAAILRSGALGTIKEVHVWTNRPVWPQGTGLEIKEEPVPPNVHWPEFIGRAKMRPYSPAYHPFKWRGFWDFGTGALGDMACHTLNMPFMGLDLRDPVWLQATSAGHDGYVYPKWSVIAAEFPARGNRGSLMFKWYDGGKVPTGEPFDGIFATAINQAASKGKDDAGKKKAGDQLKGKLRSGALVIGDKGWVLAPGDYAGDGLFFPDGMEKPKVEWVKSPGHFQEWVRAIKGGEPAMSNFPDYAGPLTETVLLGNLAVWAARDAETPGKKIDWDAKSLTATNAPEVAHIIKPEYHNGYVL